MELELRTLHPPRYQKFDDDFFFALCQVNETTRLERDAHGNIIFIPLARTETGRYNADLSGEIWNWNRRNKLGYTFDSSTGFKLANSAVRSPDVAWVSLDRWEAIPESDRQGFAPLCPDFVVEIRSKSDDLKDLKEKMEEYRDNSCGLGWLIDRKEKQVFIYRENGSIEIKQGTFVGLSGEDILPDLSIQIDL
ncbi:Uma2 family endonuclease [Spirosoma endbachense]|uniref:Uma2 family endonuclease n=1 Tax=Spirosoma endbachense TaxID=2666025 RepID=A0A6P1VWE1_9BACT|nr:Uma2 family endonuclease [Spirosoma endbachense]QHV96160.1 Uma2 family endonuclease [Spirosoma endbachense]